MRRITTILILVGAALLAAPRPATGHVQPSPNENNRGLKLTPLGDRVRLAYTIYFGEAPGAALRRQLDRDRDGLIGDAEAARFGREVAAAVQPALSVDIDGKPAVLRWDDVEVGLGTPETRAGSFAVDLVAVACLSSRGEHEVVVRDSYALPIPGETELLVDLGIGVRADHIRLGHAAVLGTEVKLRGVGGPLAEGWAVKLTIGPDAPVGGAPCGAATPTPRPSRVWWLGLIAAAAALAGVALWYRARSARGTRTSRRSASS